jgi:hypothetical protein
MLRLLLFLALGALLIAADVWYVRGLWTTYFAPRRVERIAPFELLGDDEAKNKGLIFAHRLQARCNQIQIQVAETIRTLEDAERSAGRAGRTQDLKPEAAVDLPDGVLSPIDLSLKVGEMNVAPWINWLRGLALETGTIRVVMAKEETTWQASVSGEALANGGFAVNSTTDKEAEVLDLIAWELAQRQLAKEVPEVSQLTVHGFDDLIDTMDELSKLSRRLASGGTVGKADYAPHLAKLDALLEQAGRWQALLQVTARVAESSGDLEKASELLRRQLSLGEVGSASTKRVQAEIDRIGAVIDAQARAQLAQAAGIGPPEEALGWIRELLGVPAEAMTQAVRVAILGGPPDPRFLTGAVEVLAAPGDGTSTRYGEGSTTAYATGLGVLVRLVAPNATLIFAPLGDVVSYPELAAALNRAAAAKASVVLAPYGGGSDPEVEAPLTQAFAHAAAAGITVVRAAGNEPGKPIGLAGSPLLESMLVASASTRSAEAAPFTQRDETSVWAPGIDVPVPTEEGTWQLGAGTGWAAALAAGVAARVVAVEPGIRPNDLVRLLRATASAPTTASGVPVLNATKAIAAARQAASAPVAPGR